MHALQLVGEALQSEGLAIGPHLNDEILFARQRPGFWQSRGAAVAAAAMLETLGFELPIEHHPHLRKPGSGPFADLDAAFAAYAARRQPGEQRGTGAAATGTADVTIADDGDRANAGGATAARGRARRAPGRAPQQPQ